MTAPVSLPCAAVGLPEVAVAPAAPDDAFASLLVALSGALGAGVAPVPAPSAPVDATAVAAGAAVDAPAGGQPTLPDTASPVAWAATTQRAALVPPTTNPSTAIPAPVPAAVAPPTAPTTPTTPTTTVAAEPATAEAAAPTASPAEAPSTAASSKDADVVPQEPQAEPVQQRDAAAPLPVVPVVDQPVVVQAAAPTTPSTRVEVPSSAAATRHVQPAVAEAARGLRHEGGGRTSLVVRLDPPELGAVLVRLTVQDGRVDVQLRTPDLAARTELQSQSYDVKQVLREQGFDLSSFNVSHGDVFTSNQGDSPDRGTPQRSRQSDGRAGNPHVTDDAAEPELSGTWL